jgi:hypothetical protein
MAGISPIQVGDYVDIGLDDIVSRYVVLAEGFSPTQIYISPVNNVSFRHKLVYINGEWKVKHAEHMDYTITFHHKHQGHYTPNYSGASASISPQFQPAPQFQPTVSPQSRSVSVSPQFQPAPQFQPTFSPQFQPVPTVSPPFQLSSAFDPSSGEISTTNRRYLSDQLKQLPEGKLLDVTLMGNDGLGAMTIYKNEGMGLTVIPGLDIGSKSLEYYGVALEALVKENYINVDQAIYYYDKYMDVMGANGDMRDYVRDRFYESIRPPMVKSARKR